MSLRISLADELRQMRWELGAKPHHPLCLPEPSGISEIVEVPRWPHRSEVPRRPEFGPGRINVDIGLYSCECDDWKNNRAAVPPSSIGRCCLHLRIAFLRHRLSELSPWTITVLRASGEFLPPIRYEYAIFDHHQEQYLALYDIDRGYVQIYERDSPIQLGYDISRNRWANGCGPLNPLAFKRQLRPWIKVLDTKYGN